MAKLFNYLSLFYIIAIGAIATYVRLVSLPCDYTQAGETTNSFGLVVDCGEAQGRLYLF